MLTTPVLFERASLAFEHSGFLVTHGFGYPSSNGQCTTGDKYVNNHSVWGPELLAQHRDDVFFREAVKCVQVWHVKV